ncbi:MAG: hypothetical protein A2161_15445 [Candidatus Schekmanbacteria bacterium RBG_13_48_7]|uniref:PatA-like N-terminal domain-containing protein n=1 Tax=Candidatus Schekmanbacteria bacterium RBG_13_48_7 TaxID=1817878 RepID=A0A1F7S1A8_9BACT|nr:MAG: hypothetical protein A2161_15445 [Candidatus Schekmanbacteria bacterium RBG_13_48_7]
MTIQDVIQWLNIGVKTGTLEVINKNENCLIYFKNGIIIAASSNNSRNHLGQFLKREGLITDKQIEKVRLLQDKTDDIFGLILLELGMLKEKDLHEGVKKQAEEIIFGIFDWNEGDFEFHDDELPSDQFIPVTLLAHNLIIEGAHRKDEWQKIKDLFPSRNIILALTERGQSELLNLELPGLDAEVMSKINGKRSIDEIINLCGTSDYSVFKTLEKFMLLDEIKVAGVKKAVEKPDKIKELMNEAKILRTEGYLEEAVLTLKKAYNEDPQNPEVWQELQSAQLSMEDAMKKVIGNLNRIPVLLTALDSPKIKSLILSAEEGFLLSRIDDFCTIKEIMSISGLKKEQVYHGLYKFLKKEIVGFQDQKKFINEIKGHEPKSLSEKLIRTFEMEFAMNGIKRVLTPHDQMEIINFYNKIKNADYFSMLNANRDSDKTEVVNSFKALISQYYPGQFLEMSPFFSMKLKAVIALLSAAVDTLCSNNKRLEYEKTL